jgi:lipoprotein signal peptidase
MVERSYRGVLWGLALLGATLDLGSKYLVFAWLNEHAVVASDGAREGTFDLIPGVFKLLAQFRADKVPTTGFGAGWLYWGADVMPRVNQGALFGLGGEYMKLANGIFAAVSVLAAGAIVYWSLRRSTARDWSLCAALGLILGGTLGNLFDRLVFHGVRDFLYFYWINWPVFNIADCCLVLGAALLLVQAFFSRPVVDEETPAAAPVRLTPEVAEAK